MIERDPKAKVPDYFVEELTSGKMTFARWPTEKRHECLHHYRELAACRDLLMELNAYTLTDVSLDRKSQK